MTTITTVATTTTRIIITTGTMTGASPSVTFDLKRVRAQPGPSFCVCRRFSSLG